MRAELVCADGVRLLMDYLEDALAPAQRRAIDGHLAGCLRCVAFVRSYRETPRILRDATLGALPADVEGRLRRFLKERLRNPPP